MGEWMGEWKGEWIDGCMDRLDRQTYRQSDIHTELQIVRVTSGVNHGGTGKDCPLKSFDWGDRSVGTKSNFFYRRICLACVSAYQLDQRLYSSGDCGRTGLGSIIIWFRRSSQY